MKTSGNELRALQTELGATPIEVCAEADVSITTLYNVYGNRCRNPNSVNRVRKALDKLKITKSKAAS